MRIRRTDSTAHKENVGALIHGDVRKEGIVDQ